jgi:hypothetical protein
MRRNLSRETRSEATNHHLRSYSLAAAAAGVSLLALAQPAEGSVVVKHKTIPIGNGTTIDLNGDGINDFEFAVGAGGYIPLVYATLAIAPLTGGKVVGGKRALLGPYASALASGANIGSTAHFSSSIGRGQICIERSISSQTAFSHKLYGQWGNLASSRFLGVRFLIKGAIHYGWIRLTVTGTLGTITEYAYETVANKKIGAGSTTDSATESASWPAKKDTAMPSGPSLGMLARGADGLALWRRQELEP